ncbi:hypothetical protein O181_063663 [Austropuccinia psidii MF-1]|uniref:Uncharacterized protein n=1 Tax=Austropuccinia psidii MF-1 TaxID=1389203 RepID=A0A9Q3ES25_9BASI|nr:hypothetical protein [Austropuccinia psidii MF-1]
MEQSDYPADEGWQWQEDIQCCANCHHVLSPMEFKCLSKSSFLSLTNFSSGSKTDSSSSPIEQNQTNPPLQDPPVPQITWEKTLPQPTPGPSRTQCELTLPPFVEPPWHNVPPIPGPSQASDYQLPSHEPEVAPVKSTEDCFACPATPPSIITINDMPVRTPHPPLPLVPSTEIPPITSENPIPSPPAQSSPHSHNEALQELTNLQPTLMIS